MACRGRRLSLLWLAVSCEIGLIAGCNVGPKYRPPDVPAPPALRGPDDSQVKSESQNSLGDERWATVYQEPELQALLRKALANNFDVRIAAELIIDHEDHVKITIE